MRLLARTVAVLAAAALAACASLPPPAPRTASFADDDVADTTLAQIVAASTPADAAGLSGFRLLADGGPAWEARLALIDRAERSLDAQTYSIAADASGRAFVGALRRAAARGVRVRLLVDDLYAHESAALLHALARQPMAEVRLFNPLPAREGPLALRLLRSVHEFGRINRRMHNKLLLADHRLAITGGRNIGDAYFGTGDAFFIDLDLLAAGAAVQELSALFDRFWNSTASRPLAEVGLAADAAAPPGHEAPEDAAAAAGTVPPSPGPSQALDQGRLPLHWGRARLFADPPERASRGAPHAGPAEPERDGAVLGAVAALAQGDSELLVVSPYFIPGSEGLARIAAARARGLQVRVLTNSASATDEPLAHARYAVYRRQVVELGVEVYELSATLAGRRRGTAGDSASSHGRLHAKWAVVDRRRVLVGSMNLDPRSALLNTELGLLIDSPELAHELLHGAPGQVLDDAWRVRPAGSNGALVWQGVRDGQALAAEPGFGAGRRLLLSLLSLFVPEELL
ncbi:MAG: phospholipase D family protein [Burkholderiaceae bacterium]|nr:phospholipase D family protein [Burkholderiaceae bacterium]